jgi:superfamily II DNA or RNA helicase
MLDALTADPLDIYQPHRAVANAYQKLSALEKSIVQLYSVIYEPISRASMVACLIHAGIQDKASKPFSQQTLKPVCDRLIKEEVLLQSGGQGAQCNPLLVEIATRDAVQLKRFESLVTVVQAKLPVPQRYRGGPRYFTNDFQLIREMRIGIYRHDVKYVFQQIEEYGQSNYLSDKLSLPEVFHLVCNNPFDAAWVRTLPLELYALAFSSILDDSLLYLLPATPVLTALSEDCATAEKATDMQQILLVEQLMMRGKLPEAQQALQRVADLTSDRVGSLVGAMSFLQGRDEDAIAQYTSALQLLRKSSGKRKVYFQTIAGLFFVLALIGRGAGTEPDAKRLTEAVEYASIMRQSRNWLSSLYSLLESLAKFYQGDLTQKNYIVGGAILGNQQSLEVLLRALCFYWVDADHAKKVLPKILEAYSQQATAAGYDWLAMEAAALLGRLRPRNPLGEQAALWHQRTGIRPLVDLVQRQESWEVCLTALTRMNKDASAIAKTPNSQRLAWFLTFYSTHNYLIEPREQKMSAQGSWSKGRPIALKRLRKPGDFDYLTPQDLRVCGELEQEPNYGYYGSSNAYSFGNKAIVALIGHPLVFWESAPTTRVDIVKGEPELLVKKSKENTLTLQFVPDLKDNQAILVVKESPTRLKVLEITQEHRRIAEILGKQNRLEVPTVAKERVLAAINAISSIVTVHSDIGGGGANAEEVPADPKPHVHLLPSGTGLKVAVLARPFAQDGPYYAPGAGGETVIAEIGGKRLQTTRNLKEEKQLAKGAIAACPTLTDYESPDGEWLVDDPEGCLELLTELQALEEAIVLEWPEGEKMRISHRAGLQNFSMRIQRQNDWFETSGQIQLDNDLVMDMQRLMELMGDTSSRFVPLGDGQFLALTEEFRKRLDELRAFSEKSGKGRRVNPLAALALEDWIDEVGELKADKHWKAHLQRLKDAQTLEPQLPSTLQAELRDYQVDGFNWLSRLAHWGVGACLADDMGLGKTLQALALILTRAPQGPTLIVAPTSVGMNWMSEAQRFAPTLNPIQFSTTQRQQLLDGLRPFDMLVCSYGLLQQEEVGEMLAQVKWQTIVLDEAQSIKNFATKRSQAAMNLQGDFKILTTGTPIENHLGELWNLFRFINPGLLSSLENFNQRFATPIEKYGDAAARNQLRKLIQPFILRRTKNQVLSELPSRTEILLQVELSPEEMAFYEALRREAMTKLADSDVAGGAKHLQVLAEIMKLRRACCNPNLVKPELALPSAKLSLFGEVVKELLANRHKALVFSQFVDHLQILREYLDQQKIAYQYLDGSTPTPQRKKRVEAFQAGEGDVFLISLKAGGTGLNLTAADYVIHMDPWWNPAVEDQASDRAHRMGQKRPVTIYRLVAKNTIEEKIVDLHRHKRDLADSLLEGAEMSGKISTDDLLRLIQDV